MNPEFKVKLIPEEDKVVYRQKLPLPIHLKEDLIVELALIYKHGIITVLLFSKYASPIVAERKANGKLKPLVHLRKINSLISDDHTNNNHSVITLSDAELHQAGKNLICKLGCPQAYHCVQMADQRSVEMLAFNFASRNFAHKGLAQGLNRSVSVFSKFNASTWTQLSKLTNVLSTWTTLELQPTMLQTLPATFGQCSSAFAKQDYKTGKQKVPFESQTN